MNVVKNGVSGKRTIVPNAQPKPEAPASATAVDAAAMIAELARLREENAKLKAKKDGGVYLKVTEQKVDEETGELKGTSGAVSAYGLGRFPITLYKSQWLRLIAAIKSGQVEKFLEENDAKLATKE